jgi:hypothetical protein
LLEAAAMRWCVTLVLLFGLTAACSSDDSGSGASGGSAGSAGGGVGGSGATGGSSGSSGAGGGTAAAGGSAGGGGSGDAGSAGGSGSGGNAGNAGAGGVGTDGPDIQNLQQAGSGTTVSGFPARIGFATNDYDDVLGIVWTTDGATHQYMPNNGWYGGGAARFTPPSPNQGYSGIGRFHLGGATATSHLSMRWLMKAGPTMGQYAYGNKTLLFVRDPNDGQHMRPMIITRPDPAHSNAFVPGACDGTVCQYLVSAGSDPWWPDGSDMFWIGPSGYANQWVSWEFEVNLPAGWIRLYLTTQDGVFNDTLYVQNDMIGESQPDGEFDYIDILGGYFGDGCVTDPGNWFELDEVVIHNQHIGPPPGFVQ